MNPMRDTLLAGQEARQATAPRTPCWPTGGAAAAWAGMGDAQPRHFGLPSDTPDAELSVSGHPGGPGLILRHFAREIPHAA